MGLLIFAAKSNLLLQKQICIVKKNLGVRFKLETATYLSTLSLLFHQWFTYSLVCDKYYTWQF